MGRHVPAGSRVMATGVGSTQVISFFAVPAPIRKVI